MDKGTVKALAIAAGGVILAGVVVWAVKSYGAKVPVIGPKAAEIAAAI